MKTHLEARDELNIRFTNLAPGDQASERAFWEAARCLNEKAGPLLREQMAKRRARK